MPGALAAIAEIVSPFRIEEHHRLGRERAVLGGAERQRVDAGTPGDIGRRASEPRQRVGETRAVHMQREPVLARELGERGDLGGTIDRAGLASPG